MSCGESWKSLLPIFLMFHQTDFGGFLVCCYKAIQQLNGVEKNYVAINLMLNHNLTALHSDHTMGSHKILQLHCQRNRLREGTPASDASKSDEEIIAEIRQHLKFTVKIISFDAAIGSKLSYTICTIHLKNIFPTDPITLAFTPWATMGFTVSFILQWTV